MIMLDSNYWGGGKTFNPPNCIFGDEISNIGERLVMFGMDGRWITR